MADDFDHTVELFASFRPVTVRRMFGGAGIFADGMMFALLSDGVIFLKADAQTIPDFEREGLGPFTYKSKDGARSLSCWRMPERLYDDPEALAEWAAAALDTARRAQVNSKGKLKPKAASNRASKPKRESKPGSKPRPRSKPKRTSKPARRIRSQS